MEPSATVPHLLPGSCTTTVPVLRWNNPVSLEPVAMGSVLLPYVPEWMALGEALRDSAPLLSLALCRGCFYTNVHHFGRQATATLEAQLAVGDCLAQLHWYAEAIAWLTDAMRLCDANDVKSRDCMALLGMVHLQRQEVAVARTVLERVALLDELDEGPSAMVTLESLLNVAAVYRYSGNFAPAIAIVNSVIATAQSNAARTEEDETNWQIVIQNGWFTLGLLLSCTGESNKGCEYLYAVFRWRLQHFGVNSTRTWRAFSAWFWCSEQAGRWAIAIEAGRLGAAVAIMPPTIGDWPGKVCVTCAGAIIGAAFAPAATGLYTYLQCQGCAHLNGTVQMCPPARGHPLLLDENIS
ncbi:hypothetical protein ACHHYP_01194 [Achlya hypogyna]|uniref:Uncharacterized protein n=1 Tax=Achlya hypogyna TaxID=1202772 RepID=A0A1V9ZTN1_ACHHY|nr:hypothetical protein ACHHYP_01194 [Achlya hypogyna]